MISTIKTAWMEALVANTYLPAELKIHPNAGFDPLGVLCELFRTSTYTLVTGAGPLASSLLSDLLDARQTLYAAMQALNIQFILDPTLGPLVYASFWTTGKLNVGNKQQVKANYDAMLLEDYQLNIIVLSTNSLQVGYETYKAALDTYVTWLGTLVHPGGWDSYKGDWETAPWVGDSSHTFYSMIGVADVLPEAVQRWSELLTANPYLQLTDSMIGATGQARITELVDGVVLKKVGTDSLRYTYDEIVALLIVQLPV